MFRKLTDMCYILFFGRYTKEGFYNDSTKSKPVKYVFDTVFPNKEAMYEALNISSNQK